MEKTTKQVKEINEKQDSSKKSGPHPVNINALKRLKIIEGQVKGIQRMVKEGKYCIDILIQISAVRAALDKVGKRILRRHIDNCVTNAIKNKGKKSKELIDELMEVFSKEEI